MILNVQSRKERKLERNFIKIFPHLYGNGKKNLVPKFLKKDLMGLYDKNLNVISMLAYSATTGG